MALEEIFDLNADVVTKLEKAGQKVSGYYLGFTSNKTKLGVSLLHVFRNDKGNEGLWGSSQLNAKLSRVTPGAMTEITFTGKTTMDNGMSLKTYTVLSDRINKIDVSDIAPRDAGEIADASDESYSDDISDDSDIATAAPAAKVSFGKDHAKSVSNLLKKSGN